MNFPREMLFAHTCHHWWFNWPIVPHSRCVCVCVFWRQFVWVRYGRDVRSHNNMFHRNCIVRARPWSSRGGTKKQHTDRFELLSTQIFQYLDLWASSQHTCLICMLYYSWIMQILRSRLRQTRKPNSSFIQIFFAHNGYKEKTCPTNGHYWFTTTIDTHLYSPNQLTTSEFIIRWSSE